MIVCNIVPVTSLQECSLVHSMSTMTSALKDLLVVQLHKMGAGGLIVVMMPFSMVLGSRNPGLILGLHNLIPGQT